MNKYPDFFDADGSPGYYQDNPKLFMDVVPKCYLTGSWDWAAQQMRKGKSVRRRTDRNPNFRIFWSGTRYQFKANGVTWGEDYHFSQSDFTTNEWELYIETTFGQFHVFPDGNIKIQTPKGNIIIIKDKENLEDLEKAQKLSKERRK